MMFDNKLNTMDFQLGKDKVIDAKSQLSQPERIKADNEKSRCGSPMEDTNNMFTKVRSVVCSTFPIAI